MLEPLHLYPEEKARMESLQKQGFVVMTCNNWLCPFNNDGYCVSPQNGDECMYDDEFKEYLSVVYAETITDSLRDLARQSIVKKWGKTEEKS